MKIIEDMMTQPKVSVIIPIYNTAKYLPECVESVRRQTLHDIEIILVDDESPDNAPELCDEYARQDSRIKVVHKKNGGLGYARNSGLDVATGEYVSFIDSDDFVSQDMMEVLYNTAKKYEADEVRSGTIFYNQGKTKVRRDVENITVFKGAEGVKRFVFDLLGPKPEEPRDVKYMMSVCLALRKRSVIEAHHVRFTSERRTLSEDMIFDLDLFPKMNCIVCIPDCFYNYRMNLSSLTHTFSMEKYRRNKDFFEAVEDSLGKNYVRDEYIFHFLRLKFLYLRQAIGHAVKYSGCSKNNAIVNIKTMLNDPLWSDLLGSYPYKCMDVKREIYFFLLKNRLYYLLYMVNKASIRL